MTCTSLLAVWLAVALVQPPAEPSPAPPDTTTGLERAQALYEEGKAHYETYDYAAAIEVWTRVYAELPEGPETASIRNALVHNISTAQVMAYRQDGNVLRLKRAKQLLERYLEGVPPEEAEAEGDRVRKVLADIDAEIAKEPAPAPKPAPQERAPDRRARALVISGTVLASVGVAVSSGMIAGLVLGRKARTDLAAQVEDERMGDSNEAQRRAIVDDGVTANRLAIATGATAGVLIVVGTILAIVGATRSRRTPRAVAWRQSVR